MGYVKLETFLHMNQHTQRIFLNFEFWTNGLPQLLAKIRVFKVDYFSLPLFLVPKLRSLEHKKTSLSGENQKKQKNSKNIKT